jgi:hypothetical protein
MAQTYYQIRVKGHLSEHWTEWFQGLLITNEPEGKAVLSGVLPDQAALYGVLNQMRNLGLVLLSVHGIEPSCAQEGENEA